MAWFIGIRISNACVLNYSEYQHNTIEILNKTHTVAKPLRHRGDFSTFKQYSTLHPMKLTRGLKFSYLDTTWIAL